MKLTWKGCLKVGVSIFLLYLAIVYWSVAAKLLLAVAGASSPLIIGGCIAYVVNIVMSSYERHYFPKSNHPILTKSRRPVCMVLAFATLVAVVALVCWIIIPQLAEAFMVLWRAIADFFGKVPGWVDVGIDRARQWGVFAPETLKELESALEGIDWKTKVGQLLEAITNGITGVLNTSVTLLLNVVTSVFSVVVTALLSVIFSIYLLSNKERLGSQAKRVMGRYLPENGNRKINYVLNVVNDCFRSYIVGQCTEAVILGALCAIGMAILRLPYAAMVGALVAFTALIPIAGAYIGAGVGAFMIMTEDPMKAVIFVVFLVILQQLEGNLIYPRVVGSSMGLPGIWVLAAVTIGGGILGIPGMLLGVPLAAAIYRLLKEDVENYEATKAPEVLEQPEPPIELSDSPPLQK